MSVPGLHDDLHDPTAENDNAGLAVENAAGAEIFSDSCRIIGSLTLPGCSV
jgi:hypothetical protein